ncbi:MAG: hypothetical protein CMM00_11790 [Rhodopirellula sp.]|nr:hypothetical protein [Rhodopirellula sp.]
MLTKRTTACRSFESAERWERCYPTSAFTLTAAKIGLGAFQGRRSENPTRERGIPQIPAAQVWKLHFCIRFCWPTANINPHVMN